MKKSKKFKTTAKEYLAKAKYRLELNDEKENLRNHSDDPMGIVVGERLYDIDVMLESLEKSYFDKVPTVNISFYIGWRSYYRNVHKIGKLYFMHGQRMSAYRGGHRSITEIPEITEKMSDDMISDMYYY